MSVLDHITIAGYRSICHLEFKLKRLNVVCGPNSSGKSNLYKALRLLARTAQGGLPKAIAQEGGSPPFFGPVREKRGRSASCSPPVPTNSTMR